MCEGCCACCTLKVWLTVGVILAWVAWLINWWIDGRDPATLLKFIVQQQRDLLSVEDGATVTLVFYNRSGNIQPFASTSLDSWISIALVLRSAVRMKQEEASRLDVVLAQLAEGTAWFEYVECDFEPSNAPFASLSSAFSRVHKKEPFSPCFAKIGGIRNAPQARAKSSPALKKIEYFTVRKVTGDGRCMFRALVLGMAANKGASLNSYEEENEADQLRLAVMDAICTSEKRTQKYEEAMIAITVEESLARYCERIPSPRFWGGESELLVLSRMCNQPIIVYIPESEAKRAGRAGGGYLQIAEYGSEFRSPRQGKKGRKPVRLLYSGSNHYDLLM